MNEPTSDRLPTCVVRVIVRDGEPYMNAHDLVRMSAEVADTLTDPLERQASEFIGGAFADLISMFRAHRGGSAHGVAWREVEL